MTSRRPTVRRGPCCEPGLRSRSLHGTFGGSCATGSPSRADRHRDGSGRLPLPRLGRVEEGFSLDAHVIEHPEYTFIVTVAGDSMEGAGIFHGDWLVVDRSLTPEDGDVVVAVLDGELTVKRLLSRDGRPMLHAENPRYPDFVPSEHGDVVIWGVVTGSFHPQRRLRRK